MLEAKTACVFLCQHVNSDVKKKPGYTDTFWVRILLMVEMILNKNKNKNNKNKNKIYQITIDSDKFIFCMFYSLAQTYNITSHIDRVTFRVSSSIAQAHHVLLTVICSPSMCSIA